MSKSSPPLKNALEGGALNEGEEEPMTRSKPQEEWGVAGVVKPRRKLIYAVSGASNKLLTL